MDLLITLEKGNRYTYPVAVMEEDQLPCCIILGINALQLKKIKLDFRRKTIYMEEIGQRQILKTSNDLSNEEYQCRKCWEIIDNIQWQSIECSCMEELLHWKD